VQGVWEPEANCPHEIILIVLTKSSGEATRRLGRFVITSVMRILGCLATHLPVNNKVVQRGPFLVDVGPDRAGMSEKSAYSAKSADESVLVVAKGVVAEPCSV
jgi:hypothetical protein